MEVLNLLTELNDIAKFIMKIKSIMSYLIPVIDLTTPVAGGYRFNNGRYEIAETIKWI